jgi:hypothetical protein
MDHAAAGETDIEHETINKMQYAAVIGCLETARRASVEGRGQPQAI